MQFKLLPNPPKIDNLPIIVNQGAATQHFVLKGERLGLITKLEARGRCSQPRARRLRIRPNGASLWS